jgi:hypothetical protein
MRKFALPFAAVLLLASCMKKDAKLPAPEEAIQTETESKRICAADEVLQQQIAENPERGRRLDELERKTQNYTGRDARFAGTLYVPVVIHVVHTNPNIVTDAQIQSQIDVLNRDFTKSNSELSNSSVYLAGYNYNNVANCAIQFYVAQTIRKSTTTTSFGTNDAVKSTSRGGSSPVDPTTKLNFWVCDLSSGLLGYAQFPGGSASTDGVVCDLQAFGTTSTGFSLYPEFNKGRTATHEIGHWFNLRHIWGDRRCGDDLIGDTPQHDGSNGGCPGTNHRSRCSGKPLEQWMNYMDYTDDACMYMFSGGQKTRMDAAIDNARSGYVSSTRP